VKQEVITNLLTTSRQCAKSNDLRGTKKVENQPLKSAYRKVTQISTSQTKLRFFNDLLTLLCMCHVRWSGLM
jgi:hypothetical protein